MSRIGRKPIDLPDGVNAEVQDQKVVVKGPKGQLDLQVDPTMKVEFADDRRLLVTRNGDDKHTRQMHGLTRALIANMVHGVTTGYAKRLLIYGTGYGCNLSGRTLELNLGYTGRSVNKGPQFRIPVPDGVEVTVETAAARGETDPAKLLISGADKQTVGQFAAEIRGLRKPEPYKGKGVRYENELVRRKQGKALTSGG